MPQTSRKGRTLQIRGGCGLLVAGESQEAGRSHPVTASPMFHVSRGTHLYAQRNFFFFIFDFFKTPFRGVKKKKVFLRWVFGGFSKFCNGQCFTISLSCKRGTRWGRFTTATRRWAHAGKNASTKRFPAFFVKGGCACISEAWGASKKDRPPTLGT